MTTTQNPEITLKFPQPIIGDRSVKYVWRSPVLDQRYSGTNSMAGEQVELEFTHDPKRKQYIATMRLLWWQPAAGFTVTIWEPFNVQQFPSTRFHNQVGVARFSEKSFSQFQTETLELIRDLVPTRESLLLVLIKKAQSFPIE
jgi:hypothetical protein